MAAAGPEEPGGEPKWRGGRAPLRELALDAALARRTPRLLRAALLIATLLLGLLPVWLSVAGPLEAALDQSRGVRIGGNVSVGTVSVDGRVAGDRLPLTLRLAPGRHTVALATPAFQRRECRLTVPTSGPGDTCAATVVPGDASADGLSIGFGLSAADLLPGQLPAVQAALDDGLGMRLAQLGVAVAPGEWYAVGTAHEEATGAAVRRAGEPLRALPAASLNGEPGNYACGAPLCPALEGQGVEEAGAGGGVVWRVRAGVTLGWDYTTGAGATAGQMRYQAGLGGPTLVLALAYDATGGWRVLGDAAAGRSLEAQVAEGLCADGEAALLAAHPKRLLLVALGPSTLEGCALKIRWAVNRQRAELAGEVICRFGALLSADSTTQAIFPGAPLASQDERAAAGG